jgi:hypothetical protein
LTQVKAFSVREYHKIYMEILYSDHAGRPRKFMPVSRSSTSDEAWRSGRRYSLASRRRTLFGRRFFNAARPRRGTMLDLLYLAIGFAFLAGAVLYVSACDHL